MPRNLKSADPESQKLTLLQDIFIVLALSAGMQVEVLRKHLRIDKRRVTAISKNLDLSRKH